MSNRSIEYIKGEQAARNKEYKLAGHSEDYYRGFDDHKKAVRVLRSMGYA